MLHFTAISITTWSILLQHPPQHASLYCKIHHNLVHFTIISQHVSFYYNTNPSMLHFTATCFILLQPINHNMLHFTAISTTTCFNLLEHASFHWNKDVPSPSLYSVHVPSHISHAAYNHTINGPM